MIKTGFSTAAHSLWAKKSKSEDLWLPLYTHMQDAAETARRLWGYWLPGGTKNRIMSSIIPVERQNDEFARKICVFLAAAHDLGKASPVFQSKKSGLSISLDEILHGSIRDAGLVLEDNRRYSERSATHHSIVSHEILRRYDIDESVAVVLGAHHGKPPSNSQLERLKSYEKNCGFGDESWKNVQAELFCHALAFAGLGKNDIVCLKLKKPAQVLLSGVIIIADWIASDESRFPLIDIEESWSDSEARAKSAWDNLGLTLCWETENNWEDLYGRRFGIKTPRPVQETLLDVIQKCLNPGIVVVEAPMGEGKTEAALSAAEVMAYFAGRGGVFFALPTQATSDAMFSRVLCWIGRIDEHGTDRHSVLLAHGKADFNEGYRKIRLSGNTNVGNWEDDDDDGDGYGENVVVHEWFSGRKKGILADFVIGTIDQLLMAGLKQKHVMLRHLGLANKVVIIDECHAYDVYMSQYLEKTLNWLGVYGVPVIVLSATLPAERRKQVIDAYLNKDSTPVQRAVPWKGIKEQKTPRPEWVESREYPLITYTDNGEVKQVVVMGEKRHLTVHVNLQSDDDILEMLNDLLADGGCAGIIVNTVNRAQAIYEIMVERFGEERVKLLHARFIATDRTEREKDLMELLGPDDAIRPDKLIVIGTQVLEQSLDLDFDVMVSDLCPMDLLIQRIGRLHRHDRIRPEKLKKAVCFVLGAQGDKLESGSEAIYGKYLLMKTRALLPETIDLPDSIPELVQSVYDSEDIMIDAELLDEYKAALAMHRDSAKKKKSKAMAFQISPPVGTLDTIVGFLDTDIPGSNEKRAEAAVRDGVNSIEVIVIRHDGHDLRFLPWIKKYGGRAISREHMPDDSTARALVGCRVNLPSIFGAEWMIEDTIKELEQVCRDYRLSKWQKSPWLKGELFLILDDTFKMELCVYQLKYDKNIGLISKKRRVEHDGRKRV